MSQDARLDEEQATLRRARILGMNYVDTSQYPNKTLFKELLTVPELKELRVIPLNADKNNILFGITTTTSQATMKSLQQRFLDQRISFAIISDAGFREYIKLYDPPQKVVYKEININKTGNEDLVQQVSGVLEQVRADDMLAYLAQQAHKLNASDIHIENQADKVRIRFRIDGVLHAIASISKEKNRTLLSAIASGANISTSSDEAQQGHISTRVKMANDSQVDVNMRIETVPAINGIDIVMRLFNMNQADYQLDKLGLSVNQRKLVDGIISKPSGLVMVVGPTGSGKTTTLYSMLNSLNTEDRKIITIEDPVEYQFAGITQISVKSKEAGDDGSFAEKLRAVLRLDPDIVMVGEIRDTDTAKTALQAALTGHLVLSTFHAGSAAAALTRLADIIGQNPLYVSAIRLVMAQRLVRRLDDATKQAYEPDETTKSYIQKVVDSLPEGAQKPDISSLKLYKPGTSADDPYGYKGQIAIREQFTMDGEVRQILTSNQAVITTQAIEAAALKSGMLSIEQDAILKVIAGETTLEEVSRVIG